MIYILWLMLAFTAVYIWRAIKGPTVWDRMLVMSIIATKTIIIIIVFASITETAYLLDFAIIYALFGFIGTIFIAQFLAGRKGKKE